MPDSIHMYTKSRIKTNKLANYMKEEKKEKLLFNAKDSLLSIRLSRNCCWFFIVPQSKAHTPIIGRKVIEYSYVSGQCRQIIPFIVIV